MATDATIAKSTAAADHAWFGSETVKTRVGNFEFKGSYPAGDAAKQLREALAFNRAVEAYLVQMHGVSWYRVWKGVADAGAKTPSYGKTSWTVRRSCSPATVKPSTASARST